MFYTAKITKLHEERCMIDEKNAGKFSRLLILLYRAAPKIAHFIVKSSTSAAPCQTKNKTSLLGKSAPKGPVAHLSHFGHTFVTHLSHAM